MYAEQKFMLQICFNILLALVSVHISLYETISTLTSIMESYQDNKIQSQHTKA